MWLLRRLQNRHQNLCWCLSMDVGVMMSVAVWRDLARAGRPRPAGSIPRWLRRKEGEREGGKPRRKEGRQEGRKEGFRRRKVLPPPDAPLDAPHSVSIVTHPYTYSATNMQCSKIPILPMGLDGLHDGPSPKPLHSNFNPPRGLTVAWRPRREVISGLADATCISGTSAKK